jgi:hypothetical protein
MRDYDEAKYLIFDPLSKKTSKAGYERIQNILDRVMNYNANKAYDERTGIQLFFEQSDEYIRKQRIKTWHKKYRKTGKSTS